MVDFKALMDNIPFDELPVPVRPREWPPRSPVNKYGMELRGALALFVTDVIVSCIYVSPPTYFVAVTMTFPERCSGVPIPLVFEQHLSPKAEYVNRGLTDEQSVITQALKWLWEHEFKEGLLFNGIHAIDPGPDHGQGESY